MSPLANVERQTKDIPQDPNTQTQHAQLLQVEDKPITVMLRDAVLGKLAQAAEVNSKPWLKVMVLVTVRTSLGVTAPEDARIECNTVMPSSRSSGGKQAGTRGTSRVLALEGGQGGPEVGLGSRNAWNTARVTRAYMGAMMQQKL